MEPGRERPRPPVVLLLVRDELLDGQKPKPRQTKRGRIGEGHGPGA
jgi:hypothetical protein